MYTLWGRKTTGKGEWVFSKLYEGSRNACGKELTNRCRANDKGDDKLRFSIYRDDGVAVSIGN